MNRVSKLAVVIALAVLGAGIATAQSSGSDKGAQVFKTKCAMCHGQDGKGQTAMGKANHLKDLASSDVQSVHDSDLKNIIENGKGKMPAYKGKLTDEQVEQVVAYLRTLKK